MTENHEDDVKYWMERIRRRRLTAGEYLKLLENFVKSGEQPEIETDVLTDSVIEVEQRNFDSSYQWYGPIPKSEILKWSNLVQNKGWQ